MINKIRKRILRIWRSKDGKVLLSNFGYLTLLQVAGYIFPLITVPYLARTIGVDGYGKIAFAAAIIVWVHTITDWGFRFTATRDIAQNREDSDKVSEIFSNTIWAQTLLMIASFGILAVAVTSIPKLWENRAIIFISFLLVPGRIMFPEWFFQGMEKMRFITILNVVSRLLFTIAVFVFIKEKSDYILQPLLIASGYMITGCIGMWIIIHRWKVKLRQPKLNKIKNGIKGSRDIFINNIFPNLYKSFSIMLLGIWSGSISNGKLDAGSKFVGISQQFMGVISRVFFPFLSRRIDKHDLYAKGNIILSTSITIALFFSAPTLIKFFYTPEFYDAILVMKIMSFSVIFMTLSNVYGANYLIVQGYERQLRNITIIISLIGFTLSFPLIYYLDYIGAALNITISRGGLGVMMLIKSHNIKRKLHK